MSCMHNQPTITKSITNSFCQVSPIESAEDLSKQTKIAYMVALVFLYGGISMVTQVPGPMWFTVLDLGIAYIPMAWLATKMSS